MSKYLEDIQGRIDSNPINETNTKYPYIKSHDASESEFDYQYMYNHDEPVSDIDTEYYDSYRSKIEELRTKTESMNEALESCLVPVEIKGMAFQPYEFKEEKTGDEEKPVYKKIKSPNYFFQDHSCLIGQGRSLSTKYQSKEFVFRTNKIKFVDDRKRRLIYDRTIHVMSLKEDEDNRVSFKDVIKRTFFTFWNSDYYSLVRSIYGNRIEINSILQYIIDTSNRYNDKLLVIDTNGSTKIVESIDDFNYPLQSGQDIDTGIPSSLYNLYNIGWIHPSMIFLNDLAIEWTKVIISVDNIDTFVIISNLKKTLSSYIDDDKSITMKYIHIPFKVAYIISTEDTENTPLSQYYNKQTGEFDMPIFIINKEYGCIIKGTDSYKKKQINYNCDRIICTDPNIKFAEFYLSSDTTQDFQKYLPDIGIQFTQSFRDFCDNDYRCKLKQFNFLGFEVNKELNEKYNRNYLLTLKNDDFDVTWHPFNIMDIRFKNLYNQRRLFKVFYNTKVLYDQDNILRIKNHKYLADEYEKYRQDVTANIETYMKEIYLLAKKDIGVYVSEDSKLSGYKYRYVTPYECFILYNALQNSIGNKKNVTFNDFISLSIISESKIGYLNGGFMIFDDEHDYFGDIVKEDTLYNEGSTSLKPEILDFWNDIANKVESAKYDLMVSDLLVPIDNVLYRVSSSDYRGKIAPHYLWMKGNKNSFLSLVQENKDIEYDYLKLRFELAYLNNMEEGSTPVDEFIFYFDDNNGNPIERNVYPVMTTSDCNNRYTANVLNALACNIFKRDPNMVLESIKQMNYSACYIIPRELGKLKREDCITTIDSEPSSFSYDYRKDPRYFYNYGLYVDGDTTKPKMLQSEWSLRRSLPEMFYFSLDKDEYTINSMHLLDEVFDFTYGFDKSYEENLKNGTGYIIGYDADKLEASIKRSIVSITRNGKQLKEYKATHVATKDYTVDNLKTITFVTNDNYSIVFDNIQIYANIKSSGSVDLYYINESGVLCKNFINVNMKHKSQQNYTVIKDHGTITDVDKDFSVSVIESAVKFDYDNGIAEFYDENGNLVIKIQVDKAFDNRKLEMSRWNIGQQYNYVMIFKNNELYDRYQSIEYTDISFIVDFPNSIKDTDMFEFVFFLNANNTIISHKYSTNEELKLTVPSSYCSISSGRIRTDKNGDPMDKGLYYPDTEEVTFNCAIACNTSIIDAENVQLLVNVMPKKDDDEWSALDNTNTTFELEYTIHSYCNKTSEETVSGDKKRKFLYLLDKDTKINGLHRVTKQGGGEYFLIFDGKVPKNPNKSDDEESVIPPDTRPNMGIGTLAFGTNNITSITFNGTMQQWNNVARSNPWMNSRNNVKVVKCADGNVEITDQESLYD